MIAIGDESERLLDAFARRGYSFALNSREDRKASPYFGVAIDQTIVRGEGGVSAGRSSTASFFEHGFCRLARDV